MEAATHSPATSGGTAKCPQAVKPVETERGKGFQWAEEAYSSILQSVLRDIDRYPGSLPRRWPTVGSVTGIILCPTA